MTFWLAASACVAHLGCVRHTRSLAPPQKLTPAERNFQTMWRASLKVLRRLYFQIDHQDRRSGVITTHPMVSKHFFEFWRRDSVTDFHLKESTLQTITRKAKVVIRPVTEDSIVYMPTVEVTVVRSDKQTPQVTDTSEAYRMAWSPYHPAFRLGGPGVTAGGHVDLGRDKTLETLIKAKITVAAPQLSGGD